MRFSYSRAVFQAAAAVALLSVLSLPGLAAPTAHMEGVPNFHEVNQTIYRGGQPTEQGWRNLKAMGITTVVDLCDSGMAQEQKAVEAAGMRYVSIPMNGDGIVEPNANKVAQALGLLLSAKGKIFIHCHKGSDRTGTVVACYRITHDHWQAAKALKEAENYGMSWLNIGMKRYVRNYRPSVVMAASSVIAATTVH